MGGSSWLNLKNPTLLAAKGFQISVQEREALVLQMLRQGEGGQDERVGGNTPLLELDDPLLDATVLGHSSANDSFIGVGGRLPSLDGGCTLL